MTIEESRTIDWFQSNSYNELIYTIEEWPQNKDMCSAFVEHSVSNSNILTYPKTIRLVKGSIDMIWTTLEVHNKRKMKFCLEKRK